MAQNRTRRARQQQRARRQQAGGKGQRQAVIAEQGSEARRQDHAEQAAAFAHGRHARPLRAQLAQSRAPALVRDAGQAIGSVDEQQGSQEPGQGRRFPHGRWMEQGAKAQQQQRQRGADIYGIAAPATRHPGTEGRIDEGGGDAGRQQHGADLRQVQAAALRIKRRDIYIDG
ncbi:hypothetical protein D3C72_1420390 [compost metagenome]